MKYNRESGGNDPSTFARFQCAALPYSVHTTRHFRGSFAPNHPHISRWKGTHITNMKIKWGQRARPLNLVRHYTPRGAISRGCSVPICCRHGVRRQLSYEKDFALADRDPHGLPNILKNHPVGRRELPADHSICCFCRMIRFTRTK
ncbi:MAG: hypothetical protein K1W14_06585 [Muribaculaceae bacterium]|jgi:hypothetical protein